MTHTHVHLIMLTMHLWAAMKGREGMRDTGWSVSSPSQGNTCTLGPSTKTTAEGGGGREGEEGDEEEKEEEREEGEEVGVSRLFPSRRGFQSCSQSDSSRERSSCVCDTSDHV